MAVIVLHLIAFLCGLALVAWTLLSAIKTFVLPRSAPDPITRVVFVFIRGIFDLRLRPSRTYLERDRLLAYFAPISLLALLPAWYTLASIGYMGMYWGLGIGSFREGLRFSGSSLFTLGFSTSQNMWITLLGFSEAAIGLILVALLIAYLPTMYAAFSRRESAVTLLEVRAGSPPSAVEMLQRYYRNHGLEQLREVWRTWEMWFADLEESHTSLPALVFFRSPQPDHSWVTAAGAVLDCAGLTLAAVDIPYDASAALCIRAGFLALRRINDFFGFRYDPSPRYPSTPIAISRSEFDAALQQIAAGGLPLRPDREQAWVDFAGWRVNYDAVLLTLAALTAAPAPWSSDRAGAYQALPLRTTPNK